MTFARLKTVPIASFAYLVASCLGASAETVSFNAKLDSASEVPPTASAGTGSVAARFDTVTKQLSWDVTYSGLTGDATAAHFHGPAAVGANAGVLVPLTQFKSPVTGTAPLTDAQFADLSNGKWYLNIHTAKNPAGEIRGQLVKNK